MKNHELISEEEWHRRLIEDKEYVVMSWDWKDSTTTVLEVATWKTYKVTSKRVGKRLMLEVREVA